MRSLRSGNRTYKPATITQLLRRLGGESLRPHEEIKPAQRVR